AGAVRTGVRNASLLAPQDYEAGNFAAVARNAMAAADSVNEYIAQTAPWALAKDPARRADLHLVLATALQAFADIAGMLKPILPGIVERIEQYFGGDVVLQPGRFTELDGRTLASYNPLFTRIDPKQIDAMTEASKDTLVTPPAATPAQPGESKPAASPAPPAPAGDAATGLVGIEDFARLDL